MVFVCARPFAPNARRNVATTAVACMCIRKLLSLFCDGKRYHGAGQAITISSETRAMGVRYFSPWHLGFKVVAVLKDFFPLNARWCIQELSFSTEDSLG